MTKKTHLLNGIIALLLAMTMGVFTVAAQNTPIPINIGDNVTGSITPAAPVLSYLVLVDQPQALNVRVFAITPGLLPMVTVYDGNNNVLAVAQNNGTQTAVQVPNVQAPAGLIRLDITTAGGAPGDLLINVQGIQVAPPTQLPIGQVVNGTVSSSAPILRYSFSSAVDQGRWLFVHSQLQTGGPAVALTDAATGEALASSSPRMSGLHVAIPAGNSSFLVEIASSGANASEAFTICVALANDFNSCLMPGTANSVIPTQAPAAVVPEVAVPTLAAAQLQPLPASNVCILGSATGQNVNVRMGPSTTFAVITQLNSSTIANVVGRLSDSSWYQISLSGVTGWISAGVVRLGGPCQLVPVVVPTASAPVGVQPTNTQFIPTATATVTLPPAQAATLNFNLPPNSGSTSLTSGFLPDPFQMGITAGGPVNVSYLGAGCSGFATSAPDFSVYFTSGNGTLLRFYFVSGGDTTMVINSANGAFLCSDDSYGTLNPTIDFNSPLSGRYDVWIGNFTDGPGTPGTLSVTELEINHP